MQAKSTTSHIMRFSAKKVLSANNAQIVCSRRQKTSAIEMPHFEYDIPKYKGPSYSWVTETRDNKLTFSSYSYYTQPLLIERGYMQWLFDHNGKRYLDFFSGVATVSVGHCHPKVTKVAQEQMNKLWHCSNLFMHPNIHEYADRLTDKLPGDLKVAIFTNSGSEAIDLAILLSRLYTGRDDILSFRNAYHGTSLGAKAVTAMGNWRYNHCPFPGIIHVMNPDPYKGPVGGNRDSVVQSLRAAEGTVKDGVCSSTDFYLNQLKETIDYSVSNCKPAAFFAEAIQGIGGVVQYPLGYIKKAFEIIRSTGGLCVMDEVQTGFGRTGPYWGFEAHDVIPDIVVMAKGIANGFPMGAILTTPQIADTLSSARQFNTFGGNPIASAIGIAVLDVIEEEQMQKNSIETGTALLYGLDKLRSKYEIIGDVRGKGLMIGVEMVENKVSRKPLTDKRLSNVWEECAKMGLIIGRGGRYNQVFRIKPPMCVTMDDVKFSLAVFDEALSKHS